MRLDNHESLQRLQEGDKAALNAFEGFCYSIYKERFPSLLRDAKDLTHDIYIKVLKEDLTKIDYPSTWLYRVVRNHCLDEIRKQKRNEPHDSEKLDQLFDGAERAENYPPLADAWIERTAEKYCKKTIRNAIERLPKKLDRIIMVIQLEGKLKDKEVLEELKRLHCQGIIKEVPPSEGAIRTRRSRLQANLEKIILRETDREEIKANLRSLELPLPVEQEILRRIPKEILRQISNSSPNAAPTASKPLAPWIDATSLVVVTLLSLGIRQTATFQPPDNLDALEWVGRVEIFNAPVTEKPSLKLPQINPAGGADGFSSTEGPKSWEKIAADIDDKFSENLVFFENALYAVTGDGIVRSQDGGVSWDLINQGLIASDGRTLTVSGSKRIIQPSIISWNGATMIVLEGKLYVAICGGQDSGWNPFAFGVYCLAEEGNFWIPIETKMQSSNGRISSFYQLTSSGKTFYIIGGTRLYRWEMGEDLWTDLGLDIWTDRGAKKFHGGEFAVSGRTVYVAGSNGELFHSVDSGETWTDVSPHLPNWDSQSNPKFEHFGYDLHFVGKTIHVFAKYGLLRDTREAKTKAYDSFYCVFRSTDGKTWTTVDGLRGSPGSAEAQLVYNETLYNANFNGVYRLKRESDSWERIAPPIQHHLIESLATDGQTYYISVGSEGVFRLSLDE